MSVPSIVLKINNIIIGNGCSCAHNKLPWWLWCDDGQVVIVVMMVLVVMMVRW